MKLFHKASKHFKQRKRRGEAPRDRELQPFAEATDQASHRHHQQHQSSSSTALTKYGALVIIVLFGVWMFLRSENARFNFSSIKTKDTSKKSDSHDGPVKGGGVQHEGAFEFYSDDASPLDQDAVRKGRLDRLAAQRKDGKNDQGVEEATAELSEEQNLIADDEAEAKESILQKLLKKVGLGDDSPSPKGDVSNGGKSQAPAAPPPPSPAGPKNRPKRAFSIKDALLPSLTDFDALNSQALWSQEDEELRARVLREASERCRPVYFGQSPKERRFRFPPAVGTRVFGFGAEGSGGSSSQVRSVAGQWNRFWVVSTGAEGQILCNGGSSDVVTAEDVGSSHVVFIPPPEDLYEVVLEAVPLTTLSSFVAAAQMPDGMGFDEAEDLKSNPSASVAARGIDPADPRTMRGVATPTSNPHAGYRAYYGAVEASAVAASTARRSNRSGEVQQLRKFESASASLSLNDGACEKCGPLPSKINSTFRGVTFDSALRSSKVTVDRVFYVGYGVTEVHVFVRHAGTYDLCVGISDTSAGDGMRVELSPASSSNDGAVSHTALRGVLTSTRKAGQRFDGGFMLRNVTSKAARDADPPLTLSQTIVHREYNELRSELSELLAQSSLKPPLADIFEADVVAAPATDGKGGSRAPLGDFYVAVSPINHVFRCTVGTFRPPPSSATVDQNVKPLCTAPLSAYPSLEAYKNRYRLGSWVQLQDGVCDGKVHCLVAQYDPAHKVKSDDQSDIASQLPPGFVKAESQSTLLLIRTEGWIWASDVCTMVFLHQDGIAETIFTNRWTSAWGSSVLKQPVTNFVEYRLGRAIMSHPFPVFMEELPRFAKVKKMPGFFSYREWGLLLTNGTRRIALSEMQGAGRSVYDAESEGAVSGTVLAKSGYQWLLQFIWGGCAQLNAYPSDCRKKSTIGMEGTWFKVARHLEARLKTLRDLYTGPDGSAIKALLVSTGAAPKPVGGVLSAQLPTSEKLSEIVRAIQGVSPPFPHHFLLDFSLWRHPMEDDVYLTQIAETLAKIVKAYRELKSLVTTIHADLGISMAAGSGHQTSNSYDEALAKLLVPKLPPPLLIIWHARPASILTDANKEQPASPTRPSQSQLEKHTYWSILDSLHDNIYNFGTEIGQTSTVRGNQGRPHWESSQLSEETRNTLKTLARDNPHFVVIPRHEMTLPFHVGNRYGHSGMHYGSSLAVCSTGTARYEMSKCLRKTWVDNMISEMWVNTIVSHEASLRENDL